MHFLVSGAELHIYTMSTFGFGRGDNAIFHELTGKKCRSCVLYFDLNEELQMHQNTNYCLM